MKPLDRRNARRDHRERLKAANDKARADLRAALLKERRRVQAELAELERRHGGRVSR